MATRSAWATTSGWTTATACARPCSGTCVQRWLLDGRPSALYAPVIDDAIFGYQRVNVAAQRADAGSLLNRMREMLAVRKEHPAFGRGELQLLAPAGVAVLAYLRTYGDEALLVVNNLSANPKKSISTWRRMPTRGRPTCSPGRH